MQKLLTIESKKYEIKIDNFEGPLDLLCYLIDKNKMEISDIQISKITDQYLKYLDAMEELNLEIASEFIVMASKLIYIKSKNLLPDDDEEKEENEPTKQELLKQIIDYKRYKEISKYLINRLEINGYSVFKNPEKIVLDKQILEQNFAKECIIDAYKNVINKNEKRLNKNAKNIKKIALVDSFTVVSKVKEMYKALLKAKTFIFTKLYPIKKCSNQEIVTAFTGLLELSKRSKVRTKQDELFGDIVVERIKNKR